MESNKVYTWLRNLFYLLVFWRRRPRHNQVQRQLLRSSTHTSARDIVARLRGRLKMASPPRCSWPRSSMIMIRDAAHLFIPFIFAALLLLLGGALLVTWGKLSRGVLVGFCTTGGVLIGLFLACHLALYCARARRDAATDKTGLSTSSGPPGSPACIEVPVRVQNVPACPQSPGGLQLDDTGASRARGRTTLQVRIHS